MTDFFQHLIHEFQLPLNNPVLIFSLILFIILLSPILLRKVNIPGIIGLIISGVIIGPFGLNILEKTVAINLFSTIGLLYIMFIAGLELDMTEFKVNRNKSLLFGLYTFAIPLAIGFPVCRYFLGYDIQASILIASMFSTHTLVAYPIVSKLGVSKNQAVAITVGGTILTDTAVLIILAVIVGNNQGSLTAGFWIRLGVSLAIFSFIVFAIIPRISKWFFQKLESEKHAHYIYVLSVVFFSAFLAEVAGVEPIIGAFAAGLALNPLIPHSSALMNRIEFIGNSLFIPFFLISVGMIVDVRVLLSGPAAWIVVATLTIVALFSKWLAALFTQYTFKYSRPQRQMIFGLSSSHAAATLAIILVGFKANILDETILNGTIILILITCVVASFATEKAAKKIILSNETPLLTSTKHNSRREHILIPVSKLDVAEKMMDFAALIKEKEAFNPITLLGIVPFDNDAEANASKRRQELDSFSLHASGSDLKVSSAVTIDHNPTNGIVRCSRELMVDIILLDWNLKSVLSEKIFGDKVESIVERVDKTTIVCRFSKPLVSSKRMLWIVPPLADRESGFEVILRKIVRLAQELTLGITVVSDKKTFESLQLLINEMKIGVKLYCNEWNEWEDFLVISKDIEINDLIVMSAARKGSLSYNPSLDKAPQKLARNFKTNNLLLTFPSDQSFNLHTETYDTFTSAPLLKGMEQIEKIGQNIGQIFKPNKE